MRKEFNRFAAAALAVALLVCSLPLSALATTPTATSFSTSVPANRQSVIQLAGADAEGTSLYFAYLTNPAHGTLSNINNATGVVIYTPTAGYTGADSFTYKVTSGGEDSNTATVTITISNAKTTVADTVIDPSGSPRQGKVTFILTQEVITPAGLVPAGTSVSAPLSSSGAFSVQLYPSRGMSPQAYYQVWFEDKNSLKREPLGLYDIPLSPTTVGLAGYKVADTSLVARYTFASVAGLEALVNAVASASIAQLVAQSRTTGRLQKWDGSNLSDSIISESGAAATVAGTLNATGGYIGIQAANVPPHGAEKITSGTLPDPRIASAATWHAKQDALGYTPRNAAAATVDTFNGRSGAIIMQSSDLNGLSGAGLAGIGTGTGGNLNTGTTTDGADTDEDGTGVVALQTRNTTRLQVENDGFITEFGPLSGTNICAVAAAAVGPGNTTIRVATPQTVAASCTVPSYVTLEFTGRGIVNIDAGQIFTVGPFVAPPRQIFAGAGLVRFSVNTRVPEFYAEWFGAKTGDGVDDTTPIQSLVTALSASNIDATIRGLAGAYTIAGALQETGAGGSNSQIVLPKRDTMLSLRFKGVAPAPTYGKTPSITGTVYESTLATGTGSVFGVMHNVTFAGITYQTDASIHFEDLTVKTVQNPTLTGIDLSAVPNSTITGVQVTAAASVASVVTPTVATSYGIKLAQNNLPDLSKLSNVALFGFYNALKAGELTKASHLIIAFTKRGIEIPGAHHPSLFHDVWMGYYETGIDCTGGPSNVRFDQLALEHQEAPWATVTDINDPNHYCRGEATWSLVTVNVGPTSDLIQNGAFYLWTSGLASDATTYNASPVVVAHHSAAQSIPYDNPTNAVFNTNISSDTLGLHSTVTNTDRFLCKKAGKAVFEFSGQFAVNATGIRQFRIFKHSPAGGGGGSDTPLNIQNVPALPGVATTLGGTATALCTLPGDYFFVKVAQNAVDGSSDPIALNLESALYNSPRVSFTITR